MVRVHVNAFSLRPLKHFLLTVFLWGIVKAMTVKLYSNSPTHPALQRLPLAILPKLCLFLFLPIYFIFILPITPFPRITFFFNIPMCFNLSVGCTESSLLCGLLFTWGQRGYSLAGEWAARGHGAHTLGCEGFSGRGPRAQQVWFPGLWKSPRVRDWTRVSSLAGGFFTTEPLGKPLA